MGIGPLLSLQIINFKKLKIMKATAISIGIACFLVGIFAPIPNLVAHFVCFAGGLVLAFAIDSK